MVKNKETAFNADGTAVKRLIPVYETRRRLHLMSGNLCAFPGCRSPIMGVDGTLKGEICHIEAVGAEGQRFNRAMTNESRRAYENLILLCYEHHTVTDDVVAYTVERLQEMKRTHEARFAKLEDALRDRFDDTYLSDEAVGAASLVHMHDIVLGYAPEQQDVENVAVFARRMQTVDVFARNVLCAIIDLTKDRATVSAAVLESRFRVDSSVMRPALDVLETNGLVSVDTEYARTPADVQVRALDRDLEEYPLPTIVQFCRKTSTDVRRILVELCFDILDEAP